MKLKNKIFSGFSKNRITTICLLCALSVLATPVYPADNGCGNDDNDRINPELALCSVHTYNIGAVQNPADAAEKQMMNDVVALKTTIMTQQMKRQYDYLEATIRRFKTQLEKAILTAQMEAAGASSENSTEGSSSKAVGAGVLAGTYDCNRENSTTGMLDCLSRNLGIARNELDSGRNTGQVRRQIESDLAVLQSVYTKSTLFTDGKPAGTCAKYNQNKSDTQACLNAINRDIILGREELQKNSQNQRMYQMGMGN